MESKCPVCYNVCGPDQMVCNICGYPYVGKIFETESQREDWENTVVFSCNAIWSKQVHNIIETKGNYRDALIEINELNEELENLNEEIEELEGENDQLISRLEELQKDFDSVVASNKECSSICEDFAAMVEIISNREKALQKKYNELKEKYIELLLSR